MIMMALVTCGVAQAQRTAADDLFDRYSGKDGFTTVYITQGLFKLVAQLDPEDAEAQELMQGLESIKILASEDEESGIDFYREIEGKLPADRYEELMVVKDGNDNVRFLVNQEGDRIRELLLVAGGTGDNALIIIRGNIPLRSLGKLAHSLDIDGSGLELLEQLELDNQ